MERVFHIFDKDDNGSISLQEFIDAMHQFAGQSPDDKIKFLFKVYDIDGKLDRFAIKWWAIANNQTLTSWGTDARLVDKSPSEVNKWPVLFLLIKKNPLSEARKKRFDKLEMVDIISGGTKTK